MAEKKEVYKIRYLIEPWGKPANSDGKKVLPGVIKSRDNYGYADDIFLASIIRDEKGNVTSIMLIDSVSGAYPSRDMLEMIRDQIDHYLDEHTPSSPPPPSAN